MRVVMAFIVFNIILSCGIFLVINDKRRRIASIKKEEKLKAEGYVRPVLKELTQEQIDDIHARGKLTPVEKVKEWESLDLCAPGDAIGSAGWRCKKFHHNCHECLIDYANQNEEHDSIFSDLKIVNGIKGEI